MHKIRNLQIDPNGLCNAKCWFCPVKYERNPVETISNMPFELFEKIIENIIEEREKPDGVVHPSFNGFYTSHYNEALLYPHFEDILKLCRKHRLVTMVLSNGLSLTPERTDMLSNYQDVLSGICLNTPAFEEETWAKRAGRNKSKFKNIIRNIDYAYEKLPNMIAGNSFSIQINGVHDKSFTENGGWMEKGPNFPADLDDFELDRQYDIAKARWPKMNIFKSPYLVDRAGLIDDVMSNQTSILKWLNPEEAEKKVIGCNHGFEHGGRPYGWLHVNPLGKAFLCCNDYHMEYVFGDFNEEKLSDFWLSEKHHKTVEKAYNEICRNCASARFE